MSGQNSENKQSRLQERIDSMRLGRPRKRAGESERRDAETEPQKPQQDGGQTEAGRNGRADAAPQPEARREAPAPRPEAPPAVEAPPRGALLHLNTGQVVVHLGDGPDKPHQRVYLLEADGGVALKRISLFVNFEFRRIGMLHERDLLSLAETGSWDRDLVVFHLEALEHRALLPGSASGGPRTTTPAASSKSGRQEEGEALRRGQRFSIEFQPGRAWEAVYWGRDNQGTVVAHRTEGDWKLMHLDLARYRKSLRPGSALEPSEQEAIVEALRRRRA